LCHTTDSGKTAAYFHRSGMYSGSGDQPDQLLPDVVSIAGSAFDRILYVNSTGKLNVRYADGVEPFANDLPFEEPVMHSVVAGDAFYLVLLQNGTLKGYGVCGAGVARLQ
jgi:hypothetical protein